MSTPAPAPRPGPAALEPDRAPAAPPPAAPGGHPWRAVTIVLVGAFMALLDTTIVNVALPSIRTGLHASSASLEWIVSGYALAYGLALVPGGRAGDRFGHKRLFLIGLTVFTLASVGCGIAQSQREIVAARIVQGLGAGLFFPSISATIQHSFTGPARSRAFGVLGAVIGVSTAIGPLLGGLIIAGAGTADGWRWVFLVNLFIGAVAIPVAAWRLPKAAGQVRRGFDPVGLGLLTGGLLLLLIPLVEGQADGWPAWTWICFASCVAAFALLAAWELRADKRGGDPLLKPGLLRQTSFSAGAVFALVFFGGFSSIFFTLSILWQEGLAHSALITGVVIAPYSVGTLLAAANSDKLSARLGRLVLVARLLAADHRARARSARHPPDRSRRERLGPDRPARDGGPGHRHDDRAEPGLRAGHRAARRGRDGRRDPQHRPARGHGRRHRGHRHRAVRQPAIRAGAARGGRRLHPQRPARPAGQPRVHGGRADPGARAAAADTRARRAVAAGRLGAGQPASRLSHSLRTAAALSSSLLT